MGSELVAPERDERTTAAQQAKIGDVQLAKSCPRRRIEGGRVAERQRVERTAERRDEDDPVTRCAARIGRSNAVACEIPAKALDRVAIGTKSGEMIDLVDAREEGNMKVRRRLDV